MFIDSTRRGHIRVGWQGAIVLVIIVAAIMAGQYGALLDYRESVTTLGQLRIEHQAQTEQLASTEQRLANTSAELSAMRRVASSMTKESARSGRSLKFLVTAYTAGPESTGKTPGHPEYGITYSGRKVESWSTIAADPAILPIGSLVYIPYFQDYPNKGVFRVEDTGSAIKDLRIDVYMENLQEALDFGAKALDVIVIRYGW